MKVRLGRGREITIPIPLLYTVKKTTKFSKSATWKRPILGIQDSMGLQCESQKS